MVELDYERLDALAEERREAFATAEPYPFTVIDDFLPADASGEDGPRQLSAREFIARQAARSQESDSPPKPNGSMPAAPAPPRCTVSGTISH